MLLHALLSSARPRLSTSHHFVYHTQCLLVVWSSTGFYYTRVTPPLHLLGLRPLVGWTVFFFFFFFFFLRRLAAAKALTFRMVFAPHIGFLVHGAGRINQ